MLIDLTLELSAARFYAEAEELLSLDWKGETEASREAFRAALGEDPNAFAPRTHMKLIFGEK